MSVPFDRRYYHLPEKNLEATPGVVVTVMHREPRLLMLEGEASKLEALEQTYKLERVHINPTSETHG